jgi:transcriptional regulator with XRE-family HTH domain
MADFGDEVRKIRTEKKLSLKEVGRRSGLSHSYISQIENGKRANPTQKVISKLARGLGVTEIELMIKSGDFNGASPKIIETIKKAQESLPTFDNLIRESLLEMLSENGVFKQEYRQRLMDIVEHRNGIGQVDFDSVDTFELVYQAIYSIPSIEWRAQIYRQLTRMLNEYKRKTDLSTILLKQNIFYKEQSLTEKQKQLILAYLDVLLS